MKFSSEDGSVIWGKTLGSSYEDDAKGLAVDPNGYVHVVGSFRSAYLSVGSSKVVQQGGSGGKDAFLARFSDQGDGQWVRSLGSSNSEAYYTSLTIGSKSKDIYVTGRNGDEGVILVRYSASGKVVMSRKFSTAGTAGFSEGVGVGVDRSGAIYLAATYRGVMALNSPLIDILVGQYRLFAPNVPSGTGNKWLLMVKLSADGKRYLWATGYGAWPENSDMLATSLSLGRKQELIISGTFAGPCRDTTGDFMSRSQSSTEHDAFVIRMNTAKMRRVVPAHSVKVACVWLVFAIITSLAVFASLGFMIASACRRLKRRSMGSGWRIYPLSPKTKKKITKKGPERKQNIDAVCQVV
jgi:hypothetical protein